MCGTGLRLVVIDLLFMWLAGRAGEILTLVTRWSKVVTTRCRSSKTKTIVRYFRLAAWVVLRTNVR